MKDASFRRQKVRIRQLCKRWQRWLLPGWTVTTSYYDDWGSMPPGSAKDVVAACSARSEYLRADIAWFMPHVATTEDWELEQTLVHEMTHAMVSEVHLKGTAHEERAVTEITRTILWVRDNAERLKGGKMPLVKGKSKAAFKKNVKTLMREVGKSKHVKTKRQALAISYSIKRGGKKRGVKRGR